MQGEMAEEEDGKEERNILGSLKGSLSTKEESK